MGSLERAILGLVVVLAAMAFGMTSRQAAANEADTSSKGARCTIVGTAGPDKLKGTPRRDVICGRGGADRINGMAGNDRILGGPGTDRLIGGRGKNWLIGGRGDDLLVGGPSRDRLVGGPGKDVLRGGRGKDLLFGGPDADLLRGGPGNDRLAGGRGSDRLLGGTGRDRCPDSTRADFARCLQRPWRAPVAWPSPAPPPSPPPQVCGVSTRPPDECAPQLYGVAISPSSGDVGLGPVTLKVTMEATDESMIALAQVRLRGPGGFSRTLSLSATNQLEYEFLASTVLAESASLGTYWIDQVTLADSLGNSVVHNQNALKPGPWHEFVLYDGPDTEGPAVEALSISPGTVDTSGGPATVTMTIRATDDLSGVENIGGGFEMPNTSGNYSFAMSRARGAAKDGEWVLPIQLPRHAAPGKWVLENLHLWDNAGNPTHYYGPPELEALPFPQSFAQVGPGDTTPPQILGLSIEETNFSGQHVVYFNVHLADDLAGVELGNCLWIEARAISAPASRIIVTSPVLASGTPLNGVLRAGTTFPATAPTGAYTVESIEACDVTWNQAKLEGAALEAKGWDLTFENPG